MPEIKALAPARIKWALELLNAGQDDSVLEIGCGSGVAAQHLLPTLTRGGWYYGVDKSPAAIKAAIARNKDFTKAARAIFFERAFDADSHEPLIFARVLAVNVNLFWTDDGAAIASLRRITRRHSIVVLVYETPEPAQRTKIERILKDRLAAPSFSSATFSKRTIAGAPMLGIVATG